MHFLLTSPVSFCFYVASFCQHFFWLILDDSTSCRRFVHIGQRQRTKLCQFKGFRLVGSFWVVFSRGPYQLLSVLTLCGQAPNNEYAKWALLRTDLRGRPIYTNGVFLRAPSSSTGAFTNRSFETSRLSFSLSSPPQGFIAITGLIRAPSGISPYSR